MHPLSRGYFKPINYKDLKKMNLVVPRNAQYKSSFRPLSEVIKTHHPEVINSKEASKRHQHRNKDLVFDPWDTILPSSFFGPRGFFSDAWFRSPRSLFRDIEATFEPTKWNPRVDVVETKNSFLIHAEIPGVTKDNVKVDIKDDMLTIKGERYDTINKKEEGSQEIHRERFFGSFSRSFTLPENADLKNIKASFKDGVLEVVIGKKEVKENDAIEVKID